MASRARSAWAEELGALVESWTGVTLQRMMGSYAIMTRGRMFAFPYRHGAVLKVDPELGARLVARGHGKRFRHMGRRFGDWIWMPGKTGPQRRRLVDALQVAQAHVAVTPPTTRKRKP